MGAVMEAVRLSQGRGGLKLKEFFFDRKRVIDAVGRGNIRALSKAGAFIRRKAKGSIRYAKIASRPGRPPHAHGSHSPLRELLFFSYDRGTRSVVIGPEKFGAGVVPAMLERGTIVRRKNTRRRHRFVGGSGEIRTDGPPSATTKPARDYRGATVDVTYASLTTEAQAARANRLNEEIYGPAEILGFMQARPFMAPAMASVMPTLPDLWANCVT